MIVASLDHIERQAPLTPGLEKALAFLSRPDIRNLSDGRVPIDGERVFAIVQRYQTEAASNPRFEYHRSYIDLQFIASGEEVIGWAPAAAISITDRYDPVRDIAFGTVPEKQWSRVLLTAGQAAVLYPEDGHAPRIAAGKPSPVLKVVVKVAV